MRQSNVISVDLEITLIDLNCYVCKIESEALQLFGVVEFLKRDSGRLECLLEVVKLESDHRLNEHLLQKLFLSLVVKDLKDWHLK